MTRAEGARRFVTIDTIRATYPHGRKAIPFRNEVKIEGGKRIDMGVRMPMIYTNPQTDQIVNVEWSQTNRVQSSVFVPDKGKPSGESAEV